MNIVTKKAAPMLDTATNAIDEQTTWTVELLDESLLNVTNISWQQASAYPWVWEPFPNEKLKVTAIYPYLYENYGLYGGKTRLEYWENGTRTNKSFRWKSPIVNPQNGVVKWTCKKNHRFGMPPYRYPLLLGLDRSDYIIIVEGEKDVHSAIKAGWENGLLFTTIDDPMGCDLEYLKHRRNLFFIPDDDKSGYIRALKSVERFSNLTVVDPRQMPGDLTETIAAEWTVRDLNYLCETDQLRVDELKGLANVK